MEPAAEYRKWKVSEAWAYASWEGWQWYYMCSNNYKTINTLKILRIFGLVHPQNVNQRWCMTQQRYRDTSKIQLLSSQSRYMWGPKHRQILGITQADLKLSKHLNSVLRRAGVTVMTRQLGSNETWHEFVVWNSVIEERRVENSSMSSLHFTLKASTCVF